MVEVLTEKKLTYFFFVTKLTKTKKESKNTKKKDSSLWNQVPAESESKRSDNPVGGEM